MESPIEITPVEWDVIESYLDQKMDPEKGILPHKELANIPHLEQKMAHVKKVSEEIEDSIRQAKIKEFHQYVPVDEEDLNAKIPKSKKIRLNPMWYAAAAVLVVLFGILWMMQTKNTPEKIFATHFKPDIGLPLKMEATNSSKFYEGMVDYKQQNYKAAISRWEILVKSNPENDTLNYFLGVANLALGKAEKSMEYLINQSSFQHSIFKEDAAYYAALAQIKEGKFEEAKLYLKSDPSDRNSNLLRAIEEQ